jgi:MinD-like ATPase involved in chromosome partitioning or flagellar assembly
MMGKVYTFYSYKGGVGRTMAMANVGALLSIWGKKVLMIDWDLEAPGLENYFKEGQETLSMILEGKRLDRSVDSSKNNIQYDAGNIIWTNHISSIPIPNNGQSFHLDLLHAGRKDDNYIKRVREMDYGSFYEENGGGDFGEMRAYWINVTI